MAGFSDIKILTTWNEESCTILDLYILNYFVHTFYQMQFLKLIFINRSFLSKIQFNEPSLFIWVLEKIIVLQILSSRIDS